MNNNDPIQTTVKAYVLRELLPGEDPEQLTESTPLLSAGILDSLATLRLVTFLEEEFNIRVEAHEADEEHLNTIQSVSDLVRSKLKAG